MEEKFGQVFDFRYNRELKLENSSYLEELTGLLQKVASSIDDESSYFFGNEYYLNSYEREIDSSFQIFINKLKNSFYNGSSEKVNIIRGQAGIGKSLFFEKGIQRLVTIDKNTNNNYIHMGVDFKNIDNNEKVEFYEDKIYNELCKNAIDCIRKFHEEQYKIFKREFEEFTMGIEIKTPHTYFFPLKFFCQMIYNYYKRPCIIVFDNIDLASVKTQMNVFDAVVNICNKFNKFMRQYNLEDNYRVYFVLRPETQVRYNEGKLGDIIDFPLPNILKISLSIMKKVLHETAQKFDNNNTLPCNVTCKDVLSEHDEFISLQTFTDVADYFYRILDYYLQDIWDKNSHVRTRLGTSVGFHCGIVNYNLRVFLRFFSDTISNGGFRPLTKEFNQKEGGRYFSIYSYIEMIIRGKWVVHPGNRNITGEGGNKAPIVYNIFDNSLYGHNQKDKIKHFMLYMRILQYVYLFTEDSEICYEDMKQVLTKFFDNNYILNATKKLVYVHLIYSHEEGDDEISSKGYWKDIVIKDTTVLTLSFTGRFYLEKLIYEFEYLYQMSLSSLMCDQYVKELKTCYKTKKELVVLYFLKSMFEILKENIESYSLDALIELKRMFYDNDCTSGTKPFRRMLSSFVLVMNNKVEHFKKYVKDKSDNSQYTEKYDNLLHIQKQAQELKDEVYQYILRELGE